jgi:hypothetical protein
MVAGLPSEAPLPVADAAETEPEGHRGPIARRPWLQHEGQTYAGLSGLPRADLVGEVADREDVLGPQSDE